MTGFENQEQKPFSGRYGKPVGDELDVGSDMLAEEILDNMNLTPIGRLLKRIASLPEIRKEKVVGVRQQLFDGKYDVENRLDAVLDRVLEDLIS
ncbi:MAG: flagellar biosynthesis anti-sigma factor FlgM [Planctomycetota bacterium]